MFTQTRPLPPPGAGVSRRPPLPVDFVAVVAAPVAAAGEGEVLGLKKSANFDAALVAVGEGAAVVVASDFLLRRDFGVAEASGDVAAPADSAGLASAFLRLRFGFGVADAAGDSAAEAAGLVSAFSDFLRCFGEADGEALGVGLCAWANATPVMTTMTRSRRRFMPRA